MLKFRGRVHRPEATVSGGTQAGAGSLSWRRGPGARDWRRGHGETGLQEVERGETGLSCCCGKERSLLVDQGQQGGLILP